MDDDNAAKLMHSEPTDQPCARCGSHLFHASLSGFDLHGCGACGGLWLTNDHAAEVMSGRVWQAAQLAQKLGETTRPNPALLAKPASCPECHKALQRIHALGIELDVCPEHGTWFDRGELEQLMKAASPPTPTRALAAQTPRDSAQVYPWLRRLTVVWLVAAVLTLLWGVLNLVAILSDTREVATLVVVLGLLKTVIATTVGVIGLLGTRDAAGLLLDLANRPMVR
jgi:Zn-finger nucleic acid-binding protein